MEKDFTCKSCSKEPTGKINVGRVIAKLDECFARNDLEEAKRTVEFWENEAENYNDSCGLLSVLNEELGLYRTLNDREKGLRAVQRAADILAADGDTDFSRATVYVNIATTLKAFGQAAEGIPYYDKAERVYAKFGKSDVYEFAALLNNKSTALIDLQRYDEAEICLKKAIDILLKEGKHDVEIGVSYISLAHLCFDRDEDYEKTEEYLNLSWEFINSDRQERNANYASAIMKCVPSYRYFQRPIEAEALEETAKEIYSRG